MTQNTKNFRKPPKSDAPEESPGSEGKADKGPQAPPPVKFSRSLMSWVVILALLIMLFVVLNGSKPGKEI